MSRFDEDKYQVNKSENPDGIILRSQKLNYYQITE
jgi:hypothetical protein